MKRSTLTIVAQGGVTAELLREVARPSRGFGHSRESNGGWHSFPAGKSCKVVLRDERSGKVKQITLAIAQVEKLPKLTNVFHLHSNWSQQHLPTRLDAARHSHREKGNLKCAVNELVSAILDDNLEPLVAGVA